MIDRRFLGSGTHLLPALAALFIDEHGSEDVVDLSGHVLVLPTGRARRCFEQRLLELSGDRRVVPPETMTPSGLFDRYLVPTGNRADDLTNQIAWLHVIRDAGQEQIKAMTGHDDPLTRRECITLADRLCSLMSELGGGGYSPSEAMEICHATGLPIEEDRWNALVELHGEVDACLESAGLVNVDVDRIQSLESNSIVIGETESITIVSADPSRLMVRLLNSINEAGVAVTTIIHGDEVELANAFDDNGGVDIDAWENRPIDISPDQLVTCERVDDQIAAALDFMADLTAEQGMVERATITVPDENLLPLFEQHFETNGLTSESMSTRRLENGRIGRLLAILANYLEDESARYLAQLVRHPDVSKWLMDQGVDRPVARWDSLWSRHLPRSLNDFPEGSRARAGFHSLVGPLLEQMTTFTGEARPASEWAHPIMRMLEELISESGSPLDEEDLSSLGILRSLFESQLDIEGEMPSVQASEILRMIVGSLKRSSAVSPSQSPVAVVGWLDAHLDDADDLMITGLNEGILPSAASVDNWLPEAARDLLGLNSQRRRTARDAWLLSAILQSGRTVRLVTARRSSTGEPLIPSRLLLRLGGKPLARRIGWLVDDRRRGPEMAQWHSIQEGSTGFEDRPLPEGEPVINHLSVTAFKGYLKPNTRFDFLLQRDERIRIQSIENHDALDAMGFGSFLHEVLEQWGRREIKREVPSDDASCIEVEFMEILDHHVLDRYGEHQLPGVRLQIEIARHRLRAFAPRQAQRAMEGWRVRMVEADFGPRGFDPPLYPDADGLYLHGKIDRVDHHEQHGYQALDYKTGSRGETPEEAHRNRNGWTDLQLPLYRVLLQSRGIEVDPTGLGYITLPPDPARSGFRLADWSLADVDEAEATASEVIAIIREGRLKQAVSELMS